MFILTISYVLMYNFLSLFTFMFCIVPSELNTGTFCYEIFLIGFVVAGGVGGFPYLKLLQI